VASFYADENFHLEVVEALRRLGHDVMTALEAGKANQAIADESVLDHSTSLGRAVLTHNRWDFVRLHTRKPGHAGIVVCTPDPDVDRQAAAIDAAVRTMPTLDGVLIRIDRPA
jgi:hypothetical protein